MNNWLYWSVPERFVRSYVFIMFLVMVFIPNYVFGINYTPAGFLVNLIWFDLVFYHWAKNRYNNEE